jgi:hypothetical protein
MKRLIAVVATVLLLGSVSYAQTLSWAGNGYVVLNITNAGNVFYYLDNNDFFNPAFDTDDSSANAFSRTFTINQGDSIKLGGELQTFQQVFGTSAFLGWRISTNFSGSFSELNLPYNSSPGSNDKWQEAGAGMIEIGSSLLPGTYYLSVYNHAKNGSVDIYHNETGVNAAPNDWEARIIVIPEPSTFVLVGAGLVGVYFLRRRK